MSKTVEIRTAKNTVKVDVTRFAEYVKRDLRANKCAPIPIGAPYMAAGLITVQWDGMAITPRGEDLLASAHLIPDDPAPEQPSAPPCEACNGTGEQMLLVSTHVCDVCHGSKVKPQSLTNPCRDMPAPRRVQSLTVGKRQGSLGFSVTVHNEPDGTLIKTEHHSDGRVVRLRHNAHGYWVVDSITTPEAPSPEPNPWVLIDSEAVARSFVGKRVEIDAPNTVDGYGVHALHSRKATVLNADRMHVLLDVCGGTNVNWFSRGNVRLRVVDGDSDV